MVRDGRATVHSIISRKVTITGFDLSSYRQCMQKWNHAIEVMHEQCRDIGKERCMMVSTPASHLYPDHSANSMMINLNRAPCRCLAQEITLNRF